MTETIPMWRKILIAILSLLIITCAILIGNIYNIICYESDYPGKYDEYVFKDKWKRGDSHIGNIEYVYDSEYDLVGVKIGNRNWYSNNLENIDSDKELGELILLYSYRINDSSDPHYGESASLWIYDISR